jgi:hypothetical protein
LGGGPVVGKTRDLVVFGPARRQPAFPKKEFRNFKGPEGRIFRYGHESLKLRLGAGNLETRQGQMRLEGAVFRRKSQWRHDPLNLRCQPSQVRRSIKSSPKHAWPPGIREETEALNSDGEFLKLFHLRQRSFHLGFLLAGDLPQKLQRQMHSFRPRPPCIPADFSEARLFSPQRLANGRGQFDCDECSHRSTQSYEIDHPGRILISDSPPKHFQCEL